MQGFRDGMKDLGYQEGRNITIDYRYGGLTREISTQMSADAVASKPDLIITQAGLAHSTNALTKTIPIVAVYSGDLDFAAAQKLADKLSQKKGEA